MENDHKEYFSARFNTDSPQYKQRIEEEAQRTKQAQQRALDLNSSANAQDILGGVSGLFSGLTAFGKPVGQKDNSFNERAKASRSEANDIIENDLKSQGDSKKMEDDALLEYLRGDRQDKKDAAKMALDKEQFKQTMGLKNRELAQNAIKASKPEEPKPDQFKAATFARRTEQANKAMADLEGAGYDRTTPSLDSVLPSLFTSGEYKSQDQAERNFLNAVLRRESGASISPSEQDSGEQQYFARVGDTPEVLAQKAANRKQVMEGLKAEAGGAYDRVPMIETEMIAKEKMPSDTAIAAPPAKVGDTKMINGVPYMKINGGWQKVKK